MWDNTAATTMATTGWGTCPCCGQSLRDAPTHSSGPAPIYYMPIRKPPKKAEPKPSIPTSPRTRALRPAGTDPSQYQRMTLDR